MSRFSEAEEGGHQIRPRVGASRWRKNLPDIFVPKGVMSLATTIGLHSITNISPIDTSINNNKRYIRRSSDCFPVRVVKPKEPNKQTVVYFDFSREECVNMCELRLVRNSQQFHLGKQNFSLSIWHWGNKFALELTAREPILTDIVVKCDPHFVQSHQIDCDRWRVAVPVALS
ncbi:hypothetical protein QJS10_CPA03g01085 [Acorus calamus]|uniref:Uncharacterized protein n=1 Tax=Acorus calamus TaxID=4465 RepID=A0AAV9F2T1_ACOCL|nr:hypothetical protein QJS10_CPA03g01085 [Acorus calamus]